MGWIKLENYLTLPLIKDTAETETEVAEKSSWDQADRYQF